MGNHIITPFNGSVLTTQQQAFNKSMAQVRIAVEWSFGRIVTLFKGLHYGKSWKFYLQPVGLYYKAGVIFTNIHCCLYGNQISDYFQCHMNLDEYMHCCDQCFEEYNV